MFLRPFFLSLLFFFLNSTNLFAQKLILYTDNDSYGKIKQEKRFILAYGEPAFASFSNLKPPKAYFLISPKGEKKKFVLFRKELFDPWYNVKRIAYEIRLIPEESGDYLLCLEGDEALTQGGKVQKSFLKAVFHVEREGGWDRSCGFELEIQPYTRPYGLKKGALFRGKVLYQSEPLKEAEVTVERLRLKLNLKEIERDSTGEINFPIYQKRVKTDERGFFITNFEEAGWWLITVKVQRGFKRYGNQNYPYELTSELSLYVFPESKK